MRRPLLPWLAFAALGVATGCGGSVAPDAGDAGVFDAEASAPDAAVPDEAAADATADDAPSADAPSADAPSSDAPSSDAPGDGGGASCGECAAYGTARTAATVRAPGLVELSGLAASRARPGVLYAQNDSGNPSHFFALNVAGEALGEFDLAGATMVDWEDLAVGPCPAGSCVYIADIGDNALARREYAIFRVTEPAVDAARPSTELRSVTYERLAFGYPDGAHNAETMLVHPATGDVYIVTKVDSGASVVYRLDAASLGPARATAVRVTDLSIPAGGNRLATGGAVHPCGGRVLIRTYDRLFEYVAAPGARFEAVFAATPVQVPVLPETQGEAVGYRADGRGYFTASEGASPPLRAIECR